MFTSKRLTFYYALTPVHLGAGQSLGVIDNPIQRERHTDHPCFAGSGIKGAFRHAATAYWKGKTLVNRVFGPEQNASDHAGAIAFADGQLVAFPVRSIKNAFVYATSPLILHRLGRLAGIAGVGFPALQPTALGEDEAVVCNEALLAEGRLVLESYAFSPVDAGTESFKEVAAWLAESALPQGEAYQFFRDKIRKDLVLLSDTQLTYFARNATVVEPHVRINDATGTADDGGLFFTENLPPESIMAGLTMASQERLKKGESPEAPMEDAEVVMRKVTDTFGDQCLQLGGDATTGRGQVLVRFLGGNA